jgi:hypothetical protein
MHESTIHRRCQVASAQIEHPDKDPYTQPSEPILMRLWERGGVKPWRSDAVMGTYRGVNKSFLRLFKDSRELTGHLGSQGALPAI